MALFITGLAGGILMLLSADRMAARRRRARDEMQEDPGAPSADGRS